MGNASPVTLLFGLPVVALCLAGEAGINLAFGVVGTNLDWKDPSRMVSVSSGCLSSLASMGYMLLSGALFLAPPFILPLFGGPELLGYLIGLGLGGSLGVLCAIVPPGLVLSRVPRIGEA